MLHRIDNTTSSLPAEEVQELRRLLSGVAAGSQDDLAELYRRTRTAVYGLALSYLRNAHDAQDLTQVLAKPSAAHWLGCDQTGRDIFSRIIYGGRTALVSAVMVVVISVIIGIPLGLISGYKAGLADTIIMRCCDILLSFPSLLLAFVLVAGLGRNTFNAVLALGIV